VVEVEVPEGDDEGVYREEFRRELAKRILNILLDRETEPAKEAVVEILRGKEGEAQPRRVTPRSGCLGGSTGIARGPYRELC